MDEAVARMVATIADIKVCNENNILESLPYI